MKKKMISVILILALLSCTVNFMNIDSVQAASKETKAKKAYAEFLLKNKTSAQVYHFFALLDMNQDGVPELILGDQDRVGDDPYRVEIYSYMNRKVQEVGSGFSGSEIYYPNKHLYVSSTCRMGEEIETCYKFTGKKMKAIAEKYGNSVYNAVTGEKKDRSAKGSLADFAPYKYTVDGKTVSAKKYRSYLKKIMSGAKEEKPKWHKNNRKSRFLHQMQ